MRSNKLLRIKETTLPRHVAIIMDGNRRWAKTRSMPAITGHIKGKATAKKIITYCAKKKIQALTLYTFSSENWRRPKTEVSFLMKLLTEALKKDVNELHDNNIQLNIIGDIQKLPSALQALVDKAHNLTRGNTGMCLNLAVSYGARWDITRAAQALAQQVIAGNLRVEDISEKTFSQALSLGHLPEPDLLIRTSGENRLSNFLMWELAYAELYFTDTFWPDFSEIEFDKAFRAFSNRERRFGGCSQPLSNTGSDSC